MTATNQSNLATITLSLVCALGACQAPGWNQTGSHAPQASPHSSQSTSRQTAARSVVSVRAITFNGATLSARGQQALSRLEARTGQPVANGDYWYDARSGGAGRWGGPTEVFLAPGLELGGPLPRNASGGQTNVIVNNRAIHPQEVRYLATLLGQQPQPGRYWLDSAGNSGYEDGPAMVNLIQLANKRSAQNRRGRNARGGNNWSTYQRGSGSSGSIGVAGDGKTTCVNTASYTRCY